jgi:hypothetical protein
LLLARGRTADADEIASAALTTGLDFGIPDAFGAFGVHAVVKGLLVGGLGDLAPFVDDAISTYPHIAAWRAAAAVAALQTGDLSRARQHLTDYAKCREVETSRLFDRAGLSLAAIAALALADAEVAKIVRGALPPDPEATIVVGVGAGLLGPVNLSVAMADATLGDRAGANAHAADATRLANRLGWSPWITAAQTLAAHVAGDAGLPFGLRLR